MWEKRIERCRKPYHAMAKSGQAGKKRGQEIRCNQRWEREEAKKGVILCCKRGSEHVRGSVAKKFHVQRGEREKKSCFPELSQNFITGLLSFHFFSKWGRDGNFQERGKEGKKNDLLFLGERPFRVPFMSCPSVSCPFNAASAASCTCHLGI